MEQCCTPATSSISDSPATRLAQEVDLVPFSEETEALAHKYLEPKPQRRNTDKPRSLKQLEEINEKDLRSIRTGRTQLRIDSVKEPRLEKKLQKLEQWRTNFESEIVSQRASLQRAMDELHNDTLFRVPPAPPQEQQKPAKDILDLQSTAQLLDDAQADLKPQEKQRRGSIAEEKSYLRDIWLQESQRHTQAHSWTTSMLKLVRYVRTHPYLVALLVVLLAILVYRMILIWADSRKEFLTKMME